MTSLQDANWVRWILADPWRKLTSIALAILLWYWLDRQLVRTTTLDFQLAVVDAETAAPRGSGAAVTGFELRISTREFATGPFLDVADREITKVTLHFSGDAHVIAAIDEGERVFFEPNERELVGDAPTIEIDRTNLLGRRDLIGALREMSPSRVRIRLERKASEDVQLSMANVKLLPPDAAVADWDADLIRDEATFKPETIRLRGTQRALALLDLGGELLQGKVSDRGNWPPRSRDQRLRDVRVRLELLPKVADSGIAATPTFLEVVIPLRLEFHPLRIWVPVVLDVHAASFATTHPIPDHEVTLLVTGDFAEALRAKSPNELDSWVKENLRVFAPLPRGISAAAIPPIVGDLIFTKDQGWKKGVDYRFEMLPVTVTLNKG